MENHFKKILSYAQHFALILSAVASVIIFSRGCEWGMVIFRHGKELLDFADITFALLRDFQTSVLIAVPLWLIFEGVWRLSPNSAVIVTASITTILGLANLLLVSYFSNTLVPLGPEFWAYSITEMKETVIASGQLTFWNGIFFVLAGFFCYWSPKMLLQKQERLKKFATIIVLISSSIAVISLLLSSTTYNIKTKYKANKLAYFISSSFQQSDLFAQKSSVGNKFNQTYPFLRPASNSNVLDPFFKESSSPPNVVFLIVESLGGEFIGSNGQWTGFAPFLDSLAQQGLYWPNGLSLSGRTFGIIPSLLGSLPPRQHGFMDLGPDYPNHQSLISLLDKNGYHVAFYSAYDTYFDKLNYFLDYHHTDFVLNKQKIENQFNSNKAQKEQNYWGFSDKMMFNIVSGILDTTTRSPRLEIYHTLQSHSPFTVPNQKLYNKKFNRQLRTLSASDSRKKSFEQYRKELTTLLYTDDAIQKFMDDYRTRDEYKNTIFIITGDHWLVPIPQSTQISRYHVPIIIYSPLLKQSAQFESVNTHANILPSLTSYLAENYNLSMPDSVHWIGAPLDTTRSFRNIHSLPMMRNKNQLTEYLHNEFYLFDSQLFKLQEDLGLKPLQNNEKRKRLRESLNRYKAKTHYAIANNQFYPSSAKQNLKAKYRLIAHYDTLFQRIDSKGLTADEQFQLARQFAFDKQYQKARAIAHRLLMSHPDYHDVRLLLGRTYAWEANYDQARNILDTVLKRDSSYYDTYNALFDVEFWAGNYKAALNIIDKGLEKHPQRKDFLEKKIRVLAKLNRQLKAIETYRNFQKAYPESEELKSLRQYISK